MKPERNKAHRALNVNWNLSEEELQGKIEGRKKDPLPHLSRYRAHMHPDEVRKRERDQLPPLKNPGTSPQERFKARIKPLML